VDEKDRRRQQQFQADMKGPRQYPLPAPRCKAYPSGPSVMTSSSSILYLVMSVCRPLPCGLTSMEVNGMPMGAELTVCRRG